MYLTFTNKNLEIYFKEINSNISLTRDEEIRLFGRIARGDSAAEVEVFNRTAKLAVAIAKLYAGKPELLEDLIQEANMGILTAIKKYDPAMGYRFSSYARWWMKANITVFLNNLGVVHPSNPTIKDVVKKIREKFYKENQRDASEYELLDLVEAAGYVVTDLSSIISVTSISIDKCIDEDENITVGDQVLPHEENDIYSEMEEESLSSDIVRLFSKLTIREQAMVRMKFGFTTGYEMDYKSIAEMWNKKHDDHLTVERCRQIVVGALKKMK